MAMMWPRQLPRWVLQDPRRAAECDVYRKLESSLGVDWVVFYSRPWWGITRSGAEVDGEADFVVTHPSKGVLFIEVKGGLVEFNPRTGEWTSTDRNRIRHHIKDPVQQAVSSKHRLLARFQACREWPSQRVRLRHGVVFPNCEPDGPGPIGSHERRLFCCSTQFRDSFHDWVEARLTSHVEASAESETGPGRAGIKAIEQAIAAPVTLSVPLHQQLQSDVADQDALLTGAQFALVHNVDQFPRVVVDGGAGTGKTVVAVELANRYSRAGRTTLLCCVSEPLANMLRLRLGETSGLRICTLAEISGGTTGRNQEPFDAVIVDEGQDVSFDQWDAIQSQLLKPTGVLRVMCDSNQAVYRSRDDIATRLSATSVSLGVNYRNTQAIARVTEGLYRGPLIQAVGPVGQPAALVETHADAASDHAVRLVLQLLNEDHVARGDIAVLAATERLANELRGRLLTARVNICSANAIEPESVVVDTIARFKGLESLVAILVVDKLAANNDEVSYVGVSRARAMLCVVGPLAGTSLCRALKAASHSQQ